VNRKPLLLVIIIVVVVSLIMIVILIPKPLETPVTPQKQWSVIDTFAGSTDKTTRVFEVPSGTWRINWTYTGGEFAYFSFFVFPEDETVGYVEFVQSSHPNGSDVTHIYEGPGGFHVKVNAANIDEWTLIIEALC